MRNPENAGKSELASFAVRLQDILYGEEDGFYPNKELGSDAIGDIVNLTHEFGFAPDADGDQCENAVDHWDDDLNHSVEDWQHEVSNDNTRQGYRDWVLSQQEEKADS
jgi:hypothetical protein